MPRVIVFAGPNGAGKSTHAEPILSALGISIFVNADYIARGLAGRSSEAVAIEAGRVMLKRLRQLAAQGHDFAFESTLASRSFAPFLAKLKAAGYEVAIYYFALRTVELAVKRVALRVRLGGHAVPEADVRRRFGRSAANFMNLYKPLANQWSALDNSDDNTALLMARGDASTTCVKDSELWNILLSHASRPSAPH